MSVRSPKITIRDMRLDLEELLEVIQDLDEASRARVAQTLAEMEMDARFKDLIQQMAARVPRARGD